MYLTQSHTGQRPAEVVYEPYPKNPEMEVQIFLGSSFAGLYMGVDEARDFANSILAALPAENVEVEDKAA